MDYLQRQFRLFKFTQLIKKILSNPKLTTYKMQRKSLYQKIVNYYFSKDNPLENKENKILFPIATKQFEDAIKSGRNLDSIKHNLDFLQREFGDYFDQLVQEKVLMPDNDYPPSYSLNHNSSRVYWIIIVMGFATLLWYIVKIFINTN